MKTNYLLISAAFIFLSVKTIAQSPDWQWAKRTGGTNDDRALSIRVSASGNVYTTGLFMGTADFDPGPGTFNLSSSGNEDIFISCLDAAGSFVWAKRMGSSGSDLGNGITVDADGNIYTTGYFSGTVDFDPGMGTFNLTSSGNEDIFISKLDAAGNFIWAKQLGASGSDFAYAITCDPSGNVYTTGGFAGTVDFDPGAATSNLTSAGFQDIFISRLDSAGNFSWAKNMGGSYPDFAYSVALDGAGNVYTTGYFELTADFDPGAATFNMSSAGVEDIFISKLDSSGNFKWAKRMGGTMADYALSIGVDSLFNVYTSGAFEGTADFDPGAGTYNLTPAGPDDIFISKLDSSGTFKWAKRIGGVTDDIARGAAVDHAGNIYISGNFSGTVDFDPGAGVFNLISNGYNDVYISELDSAGNFKWAKKADGSDVDFGYAMTIDDNGYSYITGSFLSPSLSFGNITLSNANITTSTGDIYIAKLENTITGIENPETNSPISVYPNPAADQVTINFTSNHEAALVNLTDMEGKILLSDFSKEKQSLTIDTKYLTNGVYMLQIRARGFSEIKKFVVEK